MNFGYQRTAEAEEGSRGSFGRSVLHHHNYPSPRTFTHVDYRDVTYIAKNDNSIPIQRSLAFQPPMISVHKTRHGTTL